MMEKLKIDFMSMSGSYMAVTKRTDEESRICGNFMLRSLHGMSKNRNCWDVCEFIPRFQYPKIKNEVGYFKSETASETESLKITFADENCIILNLKNSGLCIDFNFKSGSDYLIRLPEGSVVFNSYKTSTKYIISFKNMKLLSLKNDKMELTSENGMIYIKEIFSNMDSPFDGTISFEEYEERMKESFYRFSQNFRMNKSWQESLEYAQYVIWSSVVSPRGRIKNELVLTSNYKFTCAWGFDNLFAMIGLIKAHPELAKKQLKNFMEAQDETGMIPGSIDDASYRFSFAKPPAQGIFLKKMTKFSFLNLHEKREIFLFLDRLIRCWLDRKDCNRDGICEYLHGNESCQDNATQFDAHELVDSAELYGYILTDLDVLIMLAEELGYQKELEYWSEILRNQKSKLKYFVKDGLPVSKLTCTHEAIESQSILSYMILLAHEHLDDELKKNIMNRIKECYLGCCGIATEALNSPKYQDDGYFRGSVFPYEMLLVDALEECGEKKLAKELAEAYCNCFKREGSYECFNSKTGEGQRECGYTSTAALFLYLFDKYIDKN